MFTGTGGFNYIFFPTVSEVVSIVSFDYFLLEEKNVSAFLNYRNITSYLKTNRKILLKSQDIVQVVLISPTK